MSGNFALEQNRKKKTTFCYLAKLINDDLSGVFRGNYYNLCV